MLEKLGTNSNVYVEWVPEEAEKRHVFLSKYHIITGFKSKKDELFDRTCALYILLSRYNCEYKIVCHKGQSVAALSQPIPNAAFVYECPVLTSTTVAIRPVIALLPPSLHADLQMHEPNLLRDTFKENRYGENYDLFGYNCVGYDNILMELRKCDEKLIKRIYG